MTFPVIPRREWTTGLANPSAGKDPAWKSDSITRRPAIVLPVSMLMVHYAGNPDGLPPGNQFLSIDSRTYMRNMFMWAHGVGEKGDEYNWCIAGLEGTVFEWAGTQQAAHCSNWNSRSIGVQFGLDVDDIPPAIYESRLLELRRLLVTEGVLTADHRAVLTADHAVDQHGQHFGSDCPGLYVKAEWPRYDRPLEPTPTPPPSSEDTVPGELVGVNDHPNYPTTTRVIYVTDGVGITYRWVRSEADLEGVKADRAAKGWPNTVTQRSFHELGRYGVLVGPAP